MAITVVTCIILLRLFCFVIFVVFDIACFAYEKTTVTNCTQKVLVSRPLPFVQLWLAVSILMSAAVLVGLNFNIPGVSFYGFKPSFKKLLKNQLFWSFNLIMCIVLCNYVVRLTQEDRSKKSFPIVLAFLKIFNLLLVYTLNYVHPLKFPGTLVDAKHTVPFLIYWSSLVLQFLENLFLFISNSLDMMENIYPLGSSDADRVVLVMLYLVLCSNVAFHLRCVAFFWPKMFHGDKDFFSDITTLNSIPSND